MKNKKGLSSIVIIIAIVATLAALVVFLLSKKGTNLYNGGNQPSTQTKQPTGSAIQNSSDLDATTAGLDKTDVDGVDTELNQMDADASTF